MKENSNTTTTDSDKTAANHGRHFYGLLHSAAREATEFTDLLLKHSEILLKESDLKLDKAGGSASSVYRMLLLETEADRIAREAIHRLENCRSYLLLQASKRAMPLISSGRGGDVGAMVSEFEETATEPNHSSGKAAAATQKFSQSTAGEHSGIPRIQLRSNAGAAKYDTDGDSPGNCAESAAEPIRQSLSIAEAPKELIPKPVGSISGMADTANDNYEPDLSAPDSHGLPAGKHPVPRLKMPSLPSIASSTPHSAVAAEVAVGTDSIFGSRGMASRNNVSGGLVIQDTARNDDHDLFPIARTDSVASRQLNVANESNRGQHPAANGEAEDVAPSERPRADDLEDHRQRGWARLQSMAALDEPENSAPPNGLVLPDRAQPGPLAAAALSAGKGRSSLPHSHSRSPSQEGRSQASEPSARPCPDSQQGRSQAQQGTVAITHSQWQAEALNRAPQQQQQQQQYATHSEATFMGYKQDVIMESPSLEHCSGPREEEGSPAGTAVSAKPKPPPATQFCTVNDLRESSQPHQQLVRWRSEQEGGAASLEPRAPEQSTSVKYVEPEHPQPAPVKKPKILRKIVIVDSVEDGWNWRKYGQKETMHNNYPRSYYRCKEKCGAKKQVERCNEDPSRLRIVYDGEHTHAKPSQTRGLPSAAEDYSSTLVNHLERLASSDTSLAIVNAGGDMASFGTSISMAAGQAHRGSLSALAVGGPNSGRHHQGGYLPSPGMVGFQKFVAEKPQGWPGQETAWGDGLSPGPGDKPRGLPPLPSPISRAFGDILKPEARKLSELSNPLSGKGSFGDLFCQSLHQQPASGSASKDAGMSEPTFPGFFGQSAANRSFSSQLNGSSAEKSGCGFLDQSVGETSQSLWQAEDPSEGGMDLDLGLGSKNNNSNKRRASELCSGAEGDAAQDTSMAGNDASASKFGDANHEEDCTTPRIVITRKPYLPPAKVGFADDKMISPTFFECFDSPLLALPSPLLKSPTKEFAN